MKRLSLWFLLFSLFGAPVALSTRQPAPTILAILHVTVIDATGAEPAPDQTVIIKGDRISSLATTGEIAIPKEASTLDASGKFLIPGLWDMHVHTLQDGRPELFFPLFIASGVTGVRDMGSPLSELKAIRRLRERIEEGKVLGPRIVAAGPIVDGSSPMFPELSIAVASDTEARQAVNDLKSGGADFIKVYSLLTRESYFAVADEARRRDIPFAGHVPESVSATEASDAGQRSVEHLSGVRLACSTIETELRTELIEARAKSDASLLYRALRHVYTKSRESYSEEKAEALFARCVENDTWQVPTLVVARFLAQLNKSTNPSQTTVEARLKITNAIRTNPCLKDLTADDFESLSAATQNAFDLVSAMRRAGVKFMAGTDAPNPFVIPGRSLHDELELLVQAGFTPMEALQSATRNPAIYLGKLDTLGTIEEGKIADLVLLEANPLEDINNTRNISAVVIAGKILPQARLEEMSLRAAMFETYQLSADSSSTTESAPESAPSVKVLCALASVSLVSLISLIGIVTMSVSEQRLKSTMFVLVSLAAGAMFGDAFIHLLPESFEKSGATVKPAISVLAGILGFFILEKFLLWRHQHTVPSNHNIQPLGYMNLFADGAHNLIDGMIIGASYLVSLPVGLATTMAVVFHEIPQEISDFAILLHAGFTRAMALFFNFLSGTLAILGTGVALLVGSRVEGFSAVMLPITAGGFIYIAGCDLLPELQKELKPSKSILQLVAMVAGAGVMLLLKALA